uniref:Isotrichodermin C-15 hydroxylase n=1 Tax=Bionectria ochroleuca TaxID=29856 RepID=A0A0B7KD80_BIOOC
MIGLFPNLGALAAAATENRSTIFTVLLGAIPVYATLRCFYLLYLHPLSRFPGPRIAAVSNTWYAYHWLSGKWPWAVENVLREYGDVVRIAPNELVFFTPQAFRDIYQSTQKGLETFVKSDFQNRGDDLGGVVWEEDPVRHRAVAKQLAPLFTARHIRSMEPVISKHIDYFIKRLREVGSDGVDICEWSHWYNMDLAADISWNEETHQMRDEKRSVYLDVLLGFNKFATVLQVFKRFPLIKPLQYCFLPISKISSIAQIEAAVKNGVLQRIERRGTLEHPDYFDCILPGEKPLPANKKESYLIGSLALQVMFANFSALSDWLYGTIYLLTDDEGQECYKELVAEIRGTFESFDDINATALASLPYLQACLEESLRLIPGGLHTGLPRLSPGATVDGHYVPKGTHVQSSIFAYSRSPRYFHEAKKFRPQRWLPPTHKLYDPAFKNDVLRGASPFSLGPRACSGRETGWVQGRFVVAKLLWTFDIIRVPGQDIDFDRDFVHFGFLDKPELKVKFTPRFG